MPKWIVILVLALTASVSAQSPDGRSLRWSDIAARIVHQLALEPDDRVLALHAADDFVALLEPLKREVGLSPAMFLASHNAADGVLDIDSMARLVRSATVIIILPGANNTPIYPVVQSSLTGARRAVHFHWEGWYPVPGGELPSQRVMDGVYQSALLDLDYSEVARIQTEFEKAMRGGEIRVTTPAGTDIRFRIGERPVTRQDGNASSERASAAEVLIGREIELPCGALRVAPLEESVNGTIVFPPGKWSGALASEARFDFVGGRARNIHASRGRDAILRELGTAKNAGRAFREFALGFNPLLAIPETESWIPYYGYGAGVVRLSLGDNSELGGKVEGPYVRWNFFTDATVQIDGVTWVSGGKLTPPR